MDNHIHLQPKGRHVEAVREFLHAGGTHLILSHMPYEEVPIAEGKDFLISYQITLDLARRAEKETGVRVFSTVGPYPVLLLDLMQERGLEKAKEIMMEGMESAAQLVREREAMAIGEVGRPHFPVPEEVMEASNEIMLHGMRLCRELSCAIVIHAESATPEVMEELGRLADKAGLDRSKVVKHYCAPLVREDLAHGLVPSILASRSNLAEAWSQGDRFLLETDFMDDPARPGAVLGISTVPKRVKTMMAQSEAGKELAMKIFKDLPEKVYGIEI